MSARDTADRFIVKYDVPSPLKDRGFVAYVHDAHHPDDPAQGASVSWHLIREDARRTAAALNLTFQQPAELLETLRRFERHCVNEAANCDRLAGLVCEDLRPILTRSAAAWRKAADELADCADRIARACPA
jgi:hypothetical protein